MEQKIPKNEVERQRSIMLSIRENWSKAGKTPRCYIETLGCQQNENDSERMLGMLLEMGYEPTEDMYSADLILFNTCAVRENAEKKMFGRLGLLKHYKEEHPECLIVVCGCMTQQEHIAKKINEKYRQVDILMGTHNTYRLPEYMFDVLGHKKNIREILETDGYIVEGMPLQRDLKKGSAWVSIMYGCNNFCTYCIVPYVRGRERSRDVEEILFECRSLVEAGVKEITLLGQNVNSYGKDRDGLPDFPDLLRMVSEIPGLRRLRFMSSHPKDISDKLLDTMASKDNICKCLHLPVQSGSNRVLSEMNRRYTKETYLEIIRKAKEKMPDIAFTTDIIIGFPTETNEDYQETKRLLETVKYDMIFSFIYSRREGTPAAKLVDVLSKEEKQRNFEDMLRVQEEISAENSLKYLETVQEVLVESISKNNEKKLSGRTETNKLVNFEGSHELIGQLVKVKIKETGPWYLTGEIEKGN